ncbi:MAG: hypothetical protein ABJB05_06860 [Parafilimonas sp.]
MAKPIVVLMNWIHMPPLEMASLAHGVSEKIANASGHISIANGCTCCA